MLWQFAEASPFFRYLHYGIWGEYFLLYLSFCLRPSHRREVSHGVFGRYCFTGAGFTADDNGLILVKSIIKNKN